MVCLGKGACTPWQAGAQRQPMSVGGEMAATARADGPCHRNRTTDSTACNRGTIPHPSCPRR
eukprot:3117873-Pleurochrysis_carterae.AAC.1